VNATLAQPWSAAAGRCLRRGLSARMSVSGSWRCPSSDRTAGQVAARRATRARSTGQEVVQRLLLDRVDAEAAAATVVGARSRRPRAPQSTARCPSCSLHSRGRHRLDPASASRVQYRSGRAHLHGEGCPRPSGRTCLVPALGTARSAALSERRAPAARSGTGVHTVAPGDLAPRRWRRTAGVLQQPAATGRESSTARGKPASSARSDHVQSARLPTSIVPGPRSHEIAVSFVWIRTTSSSGSPLTTAAVARPVGEQVVGSRHRRSSGHGPAVGQARTVAGWRSISRIASCVPPRS